MNTAAFFADKYTNYTLYIYVYYNTDVYYKYTYLRVCVCTIMASSHIPGGFSILTCIVKRGIYGLNEWTCTISGPFEDVFGGKLQQSY